MDLTEREKFIIAAVLLHSEGSAADELNESVHQEEQNGQTVIVIGSTAGPLITAKEINDLLLKFC